MGNIYLPREEISYNLRETCLLAAEMGSFSPRHSPVGAVWSGAPWFLTGWAEGAEVELMIDAGCQVNILATSVFERMCASDPRIRCRLRPYQRMRPL